MFMTRRSSLTNETYCTLDKKCFVDMPSGYIKLALLENWKPSTGLIDVIKELETNFPHLRPYKTV